MSDTPSGPGSWQASGGRWYPAELHPDAIAQANRPVQPPLTPPSGSSQAGSYQSPYEPPPVQGGYGWTPPHSYVSQPGQPPPPTTPPIGQHWPKRPRSVFRTVAIVIGCLALLTLMGCGALLFAFRGEISEALIDFSEADVVSEPASCAVTGVDFAEDYRVEATLEAVNADVASHYQLIYEITADGQAIGSDWTIIADMAPGERRTEGVFNTVDAVEGAEAGCRVIQILRVDA